MSEQSRLFDPGDGGDQVTLEGEVARIVFASEESGWMVLRFAVEGDRVTAVGALPGVREGELLRLTGRWTSHPKFGKQLEVESYLPVTHTTLAGVRRYLGSGLVPGIGEAFASRLVEHFGDRTLEVIENHPDRLGEVAGIGPKRLERIRKAWGDHHATRDVMVFLQGHGISPAYAGRIQRRYGNRSMAVLRENPYRLASDVAGIGFKGADEIARSFGIPEDSPLRARAGLLHALSQDADDGHTRSERHDLIGRAARELSIEAARLEIACDELLGSGHLAVDGTALALAALDDAERACAADLARLAAGEAPSPVVPAELRTAERTCRIQLEATQRHAVERMATAPLAILTGGPGTGKTTCLRVLLSVMAARGERVLLAAPTGRAARRMSESTGHPASTLHRLLAFSPRDGAFHRDAAHPLRAHAVVVDEVSMVDTLLLRALLDAIQGTTRLVLVGDADQLPSVGPGQVLADLLRSQTVPSVRLRTIFRQEEASGIVRAAHEVLAGRWPRSGRSAEDDFFFVRREDPEEAARTVIELVARRIPSRFGLSARRDVQVLTPMHRGACGASTLNAALQEALNPAGRGSPELTRGARTYRVGDRVMQVRNDYDREVFNGDLGLVTAVDTAEGQVTVTVDGRPLVYPRGDLDAVAPAYAVSIHKSQGSEYPAVVIPVCGEHWVMLRRNLLYTGITRGARFVALVGSNRALGRAIGNADELKRRTGMKGYLTSEMRALSRLKPDA